MTQIERNAVMDRDGRLRAWMKEHKTYSYKPEQVAHLNPPTDEERGQVELFDFVNDKPQRYFLYVDENNAKVTTWMGNELGRIVVCGGVYRDNLGGKRQSIRVEAVNGLTYSGTYFKSSGDYARVKAVKGKAVQ